MKKTGKQSREPIQAWARRVQRRETHTIDYYTELTTRLQQAITKVEKNKNPNRGKFEIIAEILTQLNTPTGKTNVMSHCNMNFTQLGQYLDFMRSNGLVQRNSMAGRVTYERTENGKEFLKQYTKMVLLLDPTILASSL